MRLCIIKTSLFLALLLTTKITFSQGINFQGVARSSNGTIIANSNVGLRLSIISKNVDATPEYIETKTVMTNAQGIFSIVVGDGANTAVIGNFKSIVWSDAPKFLKVEMDPAGGSNYLNMGATQLQYVPYAFYSYGVDGSNVKGVVPVKAGGTGVTTLDELKTALNISNSSSVDTSSLSNRINSINAVIGQDSLYNIKLGKSITTNVSSGYWNIGIGGNNLMNNSSGDRNIGIGAYALSSNTTGRYNIAIGSESLLNNNGWNNNSIGLKSLQKNTSGTSNSAFGVTSLSNNTSGNENSAFGYNSGASLVTGSGNVFLGSNAGNNNLFSNINNKLIIANSSTNSPLIYGDFANKKLKFNANIDSLTVLNRLYFEDENANDHIARYDTGISSPIIYARYFYGHYGDLVIQGMSKTYTGNIHFVTGSNLAGYESPKQRMVIMDNGNVGIGDFVSSPPTSKLQVNGVVSASGYKVPGGTAAQYLRADGTVTTSVTAGVPYSGASQATDLGGYDLTVNTIKIGKGGGDRSTNTVVGYNALGNNTTGVENAAFGYQALNSNTSGSNNYSVGNNALYSNTTGNANIAIGSVALRNHISGDGNIGIGHNVLFTDGSGYNNTAIGYNSMYSNSNGFQNTAIGYESIKGNTTGGRNVAVGYQSLFTNTTGNNNTAVGHKSLYSNTTGVENTAVGIQSLMSNTGGVHNIGIGNGALQYNTTGNNNTAVGGASMEQNTIGYQNIAIGTESLKSNTTGSNNSATGFQSLIGNTSGYQNATYGAYSMKSNTTGDNNNAFGAYSLENNTTGRANSSFGSESMRDNTTGSYNAAIGNGALWKNTTGSNNTALGYQSLSSNTTGYNNTAIGQASLFSTTEGPNNVAIGTNALKLNVLGSRNVAIGVGALESNLESVNNALGYLAMYRNTTGNENNSFGHQNLEHNTTGSANASFGHNTLASNTSGGGNTAMGYVALSANTTASFNSAFGWRSLQSNITGTENAAFGEEALTSSTGNNLSAFGAEAGKANSTGSNNTFIGAFANTTSGTISNSTALGYNAQVTASNQIQLGNTSITEVKTSGTITAAGYKISGGTSTQTLMADGTTSTNPSIHSIGESYGGGIIFYTYDNGLHGLIAAPSDQSTGISWASSGNENVHVITYRDGVNGGKFNTERIIDMYGASSFAASWAIQYEQGLGYADWYLPSKFELNLMYQHKNVLGTISNRYWSSNEASSYEAYSVLFTDGSVNVTSKSSTTPAVRVIRSF